MERRELKCLSQEASSPFNIAHSLLPHCMLPLIVHLYNSNLYIDWKILSVKKEPIQSVFLTQNAQSILPHTGNSDAMRLLTFSLSAS